MALASDEALRGAQTWTPITPSDSADISLSAFRALRFDTAGTVKIDVKQSDGTKATGITRNVGPGEVWQVTRDAVTRIYSTGTSATGIDALG